MGTASLLLPSKQYFRRDEGPGKVHHLESTGSEQITNVDFENLAIHAVDGLFAFAAFAKGTEHLFSESSDTTALQEYRSAWFELEIVNAVALDEWHTAGCPSDWRNMWEKRFLKDAVETVDALRNAANRLTQ